MNDKEILHYGVKGMRWGVITKDKPKASSSSSSTKKARPSIKARNAVVNGKQATKLLKQADQLDKKVSELKTKSEKSNNVVGKAFVNKQIKETEKLATAKRSEAEKYQKAKLTDAQKKVLLGAAIVGVSVIGTYYGSKKLKSVLLASSLSGNNILQEEMEAELGLASRRLKDNLARHGAPFKRNEKFAEVKTPQDILENVAKGINPNYRNQGGVMNCRRCSFAYELRRRGYDVSATASPYGIGQSETGLVNALINGDTNIFDTSSMSKFAGGKVRQRATSGDTRVYQAFTDSAKKVGDLRNTLLKQPNGARGEVVFDMNMFAHSMSYEIIDGNPYIFDTQKGTMYEVTMAGLKTLTDKWGTPSRMEITRLDDVDLDLEFLSNWVESQD